MSEHVEATAEPAIENTAQAVSEPTAVKPKPKKKAKAKAKAKKAKAAKEVHITIPMARVLKALASKNGSVMSRVKLAKAAGFSPISGTINRALHGYKGSKDARGYPGLIDSGLVNKIPLDIDGATEINYEITKVGQKALKGYLDQHGKLAKMRDADTCTNSRYKEHVKRVRKAKDA